MCIRDRDLADIFGFATPQAVYKWQHGVAMPTLDNLVVLAAVFGVSMAEIIAVDVNAKAPVSYTHLSNITGVCGCEPADEQ